MITHRFGRWTAGSVVLGSILTFGIGAPANAIINTNCSSSLDVRVYHASVPNYDRCFAYAGTINTTMTSRKGVRGGINSGNLHVANSSTYYYFYRDEPTRYFPVTTIDKVVIF